jgi:predicted Fe-Mo cluster-binding NifX family protein
MGKKPKAVGMFKSDGVKIVIYPKQGESVEDAIKRVTTNHKVDSAKVTRF